MNTNLLLTLVGTAIGFCGLLVALWQSLKTRNVKAVVRDMGIDVESRLIAEKESLETLLTRIATIDAVNWSQAQSQIQQAVEERVKNINSIISTLKLFKRNTLGEEIKHEQHR